MAAGCADCRLLLLWRLCAVLCAGGYGKEYGKDESRQAYDALNSAGLTFIDTAEVQWCGGWGALAAPRPRQVVLSGAENERRAQHTPHHVAPTHTRATSTHTQIQVYGFGKSEEFLGEFMAATGTRPIIATKFAPLPWRLTSAAVPAACKASLARLQLQQMDLYIQHWCARCVWMDGHKWHDLAGCCACLACAVPLGCARPTHHPPCVCVFIVAGPVSFSTRSAMRAIWRAWLTACSRCVGARAVCGGCACCSTAWWIQVGRLSISCDARLRWH